jgi:hypothetical protein
VVSACAADSCGFPDSPVRVVVLLALPATVHLAPPGSRPATSVSRV